MTNHFIEPVDEYIRRFNKIGIPNKYKPLVDKVTKDPQLLHDLCAAHLGMIEIIQAQLDTRPDVPAKVVYEILQKRKGSISDEFSRKAIEAFNGPGSWAYAVFLGTILDEFTGQKAKREEAGRLADAVKKAGEIIKGGEGFVTLAYRIVERVLGYKLMFSEEEMNRTLETVARQEKPREELANLSTYLADIAEVGELSDSDLVKIRKKLIQNFEETGPRTKGSLRKETDKDVLYVLRGQHPTVFRYVHQALEEYIINAIVAKSVSAMPKAPVYVEPPVIEPTPPSSIAVERKRIYFPLPPSEEEEIFVLPEPAAEEPAPRLAEAQPEPVAVAEQRPPIEDLEGILKIINVARRRVIVDGGIMEVGSGTTPDGWEAQYVKLV